MLEKLTLNFVKSFSLLKHIKMKKEDDLTSSKSNCHLVDPHSRTGGF